jgi:hypothetical protein
MKHLILQSTSTNWQPIGSEWHLIQLMFTAVAICTACLALKSLHSAPLCFSQHFPRRHWPAAVCNGDICVFCEVGTKFICIIQTNVELQTVKADQLTRICALTGHSTESARSCSVHPCTIFLGSRNKHMFVVFIYLWRYSMRPIASPGPVIGVLINLIELIVLEPSRDEETCSS